MADAPTLAQRGTLTITTRSGNRYVIPNTTKPEAGLSETTRFSIWTGCRLQAEIANVEGWEFTEVEQDPPRTWRYYVDNYWGSVSVGFILGLWVAWMIS